MDNHSEQRGGLKMPYGVNNTAKRESTLYKDTGLKTTDLFRREVVSGLNREKTGHIHVHQGSFSIIVSVISLMLSVALVCGIIFGRLTRTVSVSGVLEPAASLVKVTSPQQGIISSQLRHLGDKVNKGDVLILISHETADITGAPILKAIHDEIVRQISSLDNEVKYNNEVYKFNYESTNNQIRICKDKIISLKDSIDILEKSVERDKNILLEKEKLLDTGTGTLDLLNSAKAQEASELLTLSSTRVSMAEDLQELDDLKNQLMTLPSSHAVEIAELNQKRSSLRVTLQQNDQSREFAITAPTDGVISTMPSFEGQSVTTQDLLLTITPSDNNLVARLLVPSSSSGFLAEGARVTLRYNAFPYQTFGYFIGHIVKVYSAALKQSEIDTLSIPETTKEPMYSVIVQLDAQQVNAYGEARNLKAGMTLNATIAQEQKYIYEWMLEPLFSAKSSLVSVGL